jgi:DNA-directed RNA polymerase subunit RPC12/RpoP
MYCSKCGNEIQDDAAFCAKCGAEIEQHRQDTLNQGQYGGYQTLTPSKPSVSPAEIAAAESKSVASLVMGIIGIVASFLIAGLILGPIAISSGKKARLVLNSKNYNFHIALAGVITGAVGLAFSIFFIIYWIVIILAVGASLGLGSTFW